MFVSRLTACLFLLITLGGMGVAEAEIKSSRELPASAWAVVEAAPGIRMTGGLGLGASIQVLCDAHCPYCAKLDRKLREQHADLSVRWVPLAYFKPDSADVAAAILGARDPDAALQANYRDYDFETRRGAAVATMRGSLGTTQRALQDQWRKWGGFTPMIIVRTADGRVIQAMGSGDDFINDVISQAAPASRVYDAWRPASSKGE